MSADPDLVAALTRSVLPDGLAVAARDPRLLPEHTDPIEATALRAAVPGRVAEFHAGRAAARAAMVSLSMPPCTIPMGADRAPIWPQGVTGSISHSADACVAVVGLVTDWAGLGVDVEQASGLDPLLIAHVCSCKEQSWLGQQPPKDRGLMAKLIFSVKEAAYKAQYPLTGALFGFDGLEVAIDRENSRFDAVFVADRFPFMAGSVLQGAYAHAAGLLVTGVAIRQADAKRLRAMS